MQKQKWSFILIALIYIALGILFIVMPQGVEGALCYVLATAVAGLGLLYLAGYFISSASSSKSDSADKPESNGFAIGILLIMMAVFIVVKQDLIITLVPFLFGVMVLIRGLFTLQTAFAIRRLGLPMRVPMIMGLVIMAFGLFIMLFPMESGQALFILIGCGLLAAGISGFIEEIFVRSSQRRHKNERERRIDMSPAVTTYDDQDDQNEAEPDGDQNKTKPDGDKNEAEPDGEGEDEGPSDVEADTETNND